LSHCPRSASHLRFMIPNLSSIVLYIYPPLPARLPWKIRHIGGYWKWPLSRRWGVPEPLDHLLYLLPHRSAGRGQAQPQDDQQHDGVNKMLVYHGVSPLLWEHDDRRPVSQAGALSAD
jgi:hypothetical protein